MNYEGYYVTFNKMYGMCGMYMEGHIKDIYIRYKIQTELKIYRQI